MRATIPFLVALAVSAAGLAHGQVSMLSGRILSVTGNRVTTSAHGVQGGEPAQVVRMGPDGRWYEVARGRVEVASTTGSTVVIMATAPGVPPVMPGDMVNVYLGPSPWRSFTDGGLVPVQPTLPGPVGLTPPGPVPLVPTTPREVVIAAHEGVYTPTPEAHDFLLAMGLGGGFVASFKEAGSKAPGNESGMWGPGWGLGLQVDLLAWRHMGVHLGMFKEHRTLSKTTTVPELYTGESARVPTDYSPTIDSEHYRVPFMLEGVFPVGPVRFSLGAGLEYDMGADAQVSLDATTPGYDLGEAGQRELELREQALQKQLTAEAQDQVFFAVALGVSMDLGSVLIPVRIEASWNPSSDTGFVDYWTVGQGGIFEAAQTLCIRASLGVSYQLDPVSLAADGAPTQR